MGKGIDAVRDQAPLHAAVLDDLKDQLLIVLIKRLAKDGKLDLPCAEIDDTSSDLLAFSVDPQTKVFHFNLSKKS